MTTIAWDGKTLAADRQVTTSAGITHMVKIFRTADGRLIGASGAAAASTIYLDWLAIPNERMRGPRPSFADNEEDCVFAIEVMADGTLWQHEQYGRYKLLPGPLAVGSGAAFARGAMAAGKGAADAVAIAATLDADTGSEIDALDL